MNQNVAGMRYILGNRWSTCAAKRGQETPNINEIGTNYHSVQQVNPA